MTALRNTVAFAMLAMTAAHGHMEQPVAPQGILGIRWQDHWFTQGTMIGCEKATGENCGYTKPCCANTNFITFPDEKTSRKLRGRSLGVVHSKSDNETAAAAEAAVEDFMVIAEKQIAAGNIGASPYKMNPWMAPGHAPVSNPCGILGGWRYSSARDYHSGPGNAYERENAGIGGHTNNQIPGVEMVPPVGTHADSILLADLNTRMQQAQGTAYATNSNHKWHAGDTHEVSYSLVANHGGGVQFRLCPLARLLEGTLDEECFQQTPLEFVGNESWFQVGKGANATRTAFIATRVHDGNTGMGGVKPAGSTWTKVGLPSCAGASGGSNTKGECPEPQFENAVSRSGIWGYGNPSSGASAGFMKILAGVHVDGDHYGSADYSIVDKVKVPEGLYGDFVISWRWDSESTAQVWTQCAVVSIE